MQKSNGEKLEARLSELLSGATIKAVNWATYYTVHFLLRESYGLPSELELTCCSNWFFVDPENHCYNSNLEIEHLKPLDSLDCLRGFILVGLTTEFVKDLAWDNSFGLTIRFECGVQMKIPLNNANDPEEDSFLVKTPGWIKDSDSVYLMVCGDGEIVV